MLYGSIRNRDWAFYLDATFVTTSSTELLGGVLFNQALVESETATLGLAVGRTFLRTDRMSATAYIGARAWWLDNTFELRGVGGGIARDTSSDSWIDPLFGVTGDFQTSERWSLLGSLDLSGFGIGAESGFSALVAATYRVNDRFGVSVGWRHQEVDYDEGDTLFDVQQSGPLIGATFVF